MSEWQPIETAPRDGTKIDVWLESLDTKRGVTGERIVEVWWIPDEKGYPTFAGGEWHRNGYSFDHYNCESASRRVTHWMPLPPRPEARAAPD